MKNFKSVNKHNETNEFAWYKVKGDLLQANTDNISVDEFNIKPSDSTKMGLYTIQVLVKDDEVKIVNQSRTSEKSVKGKGIFEAMLPELYNFYKKRIVSSSSLHATFDGENRIKLMDNIYKDLLSRKIVSYNYEKDIYFFPPDKS